MDSITNLLFAAFIILCAAINGVHGDAIVTGTVFCDQCKDGQISLFDYPLSGTKVTLLCPDSNGQMTMIREETTNWFGSFGMRVEGSPELSSCYAQVSGAVQGSPRCGAAAGPAKHLRLVFRMFDNEMYTVDSLLSEPAQPMSFCPRSSNPVLPPVNPVRPPSLPPPSPPRTVGFPPIPRLPPLPSLPPLPPMPPFPFMEASACPHETWTMPQYKCYWRVVSPDTNIGLVFGPIAARRYGTNMTLMEGLQGRGEPYKTLLRESITSFLNSYNSIQFPYNTVSVVLNLNSALVGSPRRVLLQALRFKRANSGSGNVTCKFTPCK